MVRNGGRWGRFVKSRMKQTRATLSRELKERKKKKEEFSIIRRKAYAKEKGRLEAIKWKEKAVKAGRAGRERARPIKLPKAQTVESLFVRSVGSMGRVVGGYDPIGEPDFGKKKVRKKRRTKKRKKKPRRKVRKKKR